MPSPLTHMEKIKWLIKRALNAAGINWLIHWVSFHWRSSRKVHYRGCVFHCASNLEYEQQLLRGEYNEDLVIAHIEKSLAGRQGVFLDIGANIGVFSVCIGAQPEIEVMSFEPEPVNYRRLRRNIASNSGSRVRPFNVACGDVHGIALDFTIPFGVNRGVPFVGRYENPPIFALEIRVPCVTIDRFLEQAGIEKITGFKIDVEGYELEVLRGMETTLRNSPSCCGLVEMHCHMRSVSPTAVESLLEGAGFNLQEITRDGLLQPYHTDRHDGHAIWVEKRT